MASSAPSTPADRVRLAPGSHSSPHEGACVVELSSLIAREPFSDRPACVCPVIASFMRGWNDRAAYADRQRLRPYALRIVGTREDDRVTRERRDLCLEWVGVELRGGFVRRALARLRIRPRLAVLCGVRYATHLDEGAGEYAARVLFGRRDVDGAFVLLDAMLALGAPQPERVEADISVNGNGHHAPNGNGSHPQNGNGHHALNGNGRLPGGLNGVLVGHANGEVKVDELPVRAP